MFENLAANGSAAAFAALLGAIAGSFAVATAWRLPRNMAWVRGRSCCPACGARLAVRDLVPILSWLLAGGTARCCGSAVSPRYLWGELAGAAAFALPVLLIGPYPEVTPLFVLWTLLAVITLVDLSHRYLPDGAVAGVWLAGLAGDVLGFFVPPGEGLLAGAGVALVLLLVRHVVGRRVGREALGLGDVKLFAAAGPWVGIQGMPILVFAAASLGLLLYPLWRRRGGAAEMPFGPAIAAALYFAACFTVYRA